MATAVFEWLVGLSWVVYKLSEAGVRLSFRRLRQGLKSSPEAVIMDPEVGKISKNLVKSVSTGENVALGSFWKTQSCVIVFLRRFG